MSAAATIFWVCWGLLFYSYVLYPALLWLLHLVVTKKYRIYDSAEELPSVSILMSVRNEEKIIEEKLDSILHSNYPEGKLEVLIGSDNSSDATNAIVERYSARHSFIRLVPFEERQGKPHVINQLVIEAKHDLLLLTDANVIFDSYNIVNLVKQFKDERIGLVGANIHNRFKEHGGIAEHEKNYIGIENNIKLWEGCAFGTMIGPFGGCYMLRKDLYKPVPAGFAVDDFFIGMNVLLQNRDAILVKEAICLEDVSHDIKQEQKRKRRIANGNLQNLKALKRIFLNLTSAAGFCFFSHKVLRWFGPVLLLVAFIANLFLLRNNFYVLLLFLQLFGAAWTLVDGALMRRGVESGVLRYITYFCRMNVALLQGTFDYLKGKKAHVWEPTQRN